MKVCFVAEYGNRTAGGGKSLLALMTFLRDEYGIVPLLVCHRQFELIDDAKSKDIKTLVVQGKIFAYGRNNVFLSSYIKYPLKRLYNFLHLRKIKKVLAEENIQLVHLNSTLACFEWATAARCCGIPYIWHIREFLEADHNRIFVGKKYHIRLLRKSNAIITISKNVQSYWEDKLKRSCCLVYNGFSHKDFYDDGTKKLNQRVLHCVIVGRIVEGKRQLDAVKAIELLVNKGMNNIELDIVGYRGDGEYEQEVILYIKQKNLQGNINISSYTDNVKEIYARSDVGLMCSTREAFGRVTIEYMLAGLLVIGSNTGGTLELVDDGRTGLLYEMGNPESLAEKLEWVLANRETAKRLLLDGQRYAAENFSIERTAAGVMDVYRTCAGISVPMCAGGGTSVE